MPAPTFKTANQPRVLLTVKDVAVLDNCSEKPCAARLRPAFFRRSVWGLEGVFYASIQRHKRPTGRPHSDDRLCPSMSIYVNGLCLFREDAHSANF